MRIARGVDHAVCLDRSLHGGPQHQRLLEGRLVLESRKGWVGPEGLHIHAVGHRLGNKDDRLFRVGGVLPHRQGMQERQVAAQFA